MQYQLSQTALNQIDKPAIRVKIAYALMISEQTVIAYIKANSENLTKYAALQVIKDSTQLTESEIITPCPAVMGTL